MMRHWLMAAALLPALSLACAGAGAETLPWQNGDAGYDAPPAYQQNPYQPAPYAQPGQIYGKPFKKAYPPPYRQPQPVLQQAPPPPGYDAPVEPPEQMQPQGAPATFGPEDISGAGHRFFGRVTSDLASVIEYTFQNNGRPNGYILGEEGGGAFVAGLRYGEGTLYTKNAGTRHVFWQGPSVGYDFGGEGSKTMVLVYNMHSPDDVFYDYAGVGGQAYIVGGVGLTYLKSGPVTMAPIRSGVGLRIGANVGYLKFTRAPTWNPF